MDIAFLIPLIAVFCLAGFVKGVLGIGFPAIMIGFLTFFIGPREAIALAVIAMVMTNFRQGFRGEPVIAIIKRYWIYCAFGSIGIFVAAVLGGSVPQSALLIAAGISMILFGATSLFIDMPRVADRFDWIAQSIAGSVGAVMGGLTGIWGPPLAAYLATRKLDKDAFVQAMGLIFLLQSVPLLLGLVAAGDFSKDTAILGTAMLIPTFAALFLGEKFRAKMNVKQFTWAFMIMFILLGLNLIRRGVIG
ncbi:MAG: sulfite exporter TauE/SafE family protein [Pseudomonadota bacterium]